MGFSRPPPPTMRIVRFFLSFPPSPAFYCHATTQPTLFYGCTTQRPQRTRIFLAAKLRSNINPRTNCSILQKRNTCTLTRARSCVCVERRILRRQARTPKSNRGCPHQQAMQTRRLPYAVAVSTRAFCTGARPGTQHRLP